MGRLLLVSGLSGTETEPKTKSERSENQPKDTNQFRKRDTHVRHPLSIKTGGKKFHPLKKGE